MTENKKKKKIGIVHPNLNLAGGAESVSLSIGRSLQSDYELEFICMTEPNFRNLTDLFDINITNVDSRTPNGLYETAIASTRKLEAFLSYSTHLLRKSIFYNYIREIQFEYDLIFVTKGEIRLSVPSIHYIHCPRDALSCEGYRRKLPKQTETRPIRRVYNNIWCAVSRYSNDQLQDETVVTNSRWTAELTSSIYDVDCEVIYPPIDTDQFKPESWDTRQKGFVSVGSISPTKQTLEMIDIVSDLHSTGHNIHLHIVGSGQTSDYVNEVAQRSNKLEYISFERKVTREKLVQLLTTHKFGLHMKPYEPFGMAVAEMVAAGMIPFAPASGGQQEVLSHNDRLLFDSSGKPIETIAKILNNSDAQRAIRSELTADDYDRTRFEYKISKLTAEVLR